MQLQNEMIAELEAENEQLKIKNAEAKPKVEYYDTLIERGTLPTSALLQKNWAFLKSSLLNSYSLTGFIS